MNSRLEEFRKLRDVENRIISEYGAIRTKHASQYGCKFKRNTLIRFGFNQNHGKRFYIHIFYKGRFSGINYMDTTDDIDNVFPSIEKGLKRLKPYLN